MILVLALISMVILSIFYIIIYKKRNSPYVILIKNIQLMVYAVIAVTMAYLITDTTIGYLYVLLFTLFFYGLLKQIYKAFVWRRLIIIVLLTLVSSVMFAYMNLYVLVDLTLFSMCVLFPALTLQNDINSTERLNFAALPFMILFILIVYYFPTGHDHFLSGKQALIAEAYMTEHYPDGDWSLSRSITYRGHKTKILAYNGSHQNVIVFYKDNRILAEETLHRFRQEAVYFGETKYWRANRVISGYKEIYMNQGEEAIRFFYEDDISIEYTKYDHKLEELVSYTVSDGLNIYQSKTAKGFDDGIFKEKHESIESFDFQDKMVLTLEWDSKYPGIKAIEMDRILTEPASQFVE